MNQSAISLRCQDKSEGLSAFTLSLALLLSIAANDFCVAQGLEKFQESAKAPEQQVEARLAQVATHDQESIRVQQDLLDERLHSGPADGVFGEGTRSAITNTYGFNVTFDTALPQNVVTGVATITFDPDGPRVDDTPVDTGFATLFGTDFVDGEIGFDFRPDDFSQGPAIILGGIAPDGNASGVGGHTTDFSIVFYIDGPAFVQGIAAGSSNEIFEATVGNVNITYGAVAFATGGNVIVGDCGDAFASGASDECFDPDAFLETVDVGEPETSFSFGAHDSATEFGAASGDARLIGPGVTPRVTAMATTTDRGSSQGAFFGIQSYHYSGLFPTTRAYDGVLTFSQSGGVLGIDRQFGQTRASIHVYQGLIDASQITPGTSFGFLGTQSSVFDARSCENSPGPGTFGNCMGADFETINSVEAGASVPLSVTINLSPDDTISVVAWVQSSAQGGGFSDASSTLVTEFDDVTDLVPTGPPMASDTDSDGISDSTDNCTNVANADQRDTDGDGLGNQCDADIFVPNDCVVNFLDVGVLKAAFFSTPGDLNWNPDADFDGDDAINFLDLGAMKAGLFMPPGPAASPNSCH